MSAKTIAVVVPSTKAVVTPPTVADPTNEEIAIRAHELYVKRGGEGGHELDDWLQAERELKAAKQG